MKAYFVSSYLDGCYFVRCLLPLMANGWDGDQTSIEKGQMTPENKARASQAADVVVFHRPQDIHKVELARILKRAGKKIVFDNDDTFKDDGGFKWNEFMNKERLERGLARINDAVDTFITEADLITCSTEFLKKEYESLNKNVVVLPNCIDPFYFDEPKRNETDVVRIGITGSVAVTTDLDICMPIIKHFENRKDVQMVMFSMPPKDGDLRMRQLYAEEYKFLDSCTNLEWQPFVPMSRYFDTLNDLKLDMMIIPRIDSYFNRCKSNLKFLEASMFEIPVIAQGFTDNQSPYQQNPEDAKHMKIVIDNRDWIDAIEALINNKAARREQGRLAKEYVLKNYNIEDKAHLWEEAYESINRNSA